MFWKRRKRNGKKEMSPEEMEIKREFEAKKDLVWMILISYLYVIPFTLHYLIVHNALNLATEISLAIVFSSILMWGPHILYSLGPVREYFSAFNGKAAESGSPDVRAKGAFIYNVVYFFVFAMIGYYAALAVSAFVFHKNMTATAVLIISFDIAALYFSKWLTDRKYKKNRKGGRDV